MTEAALERPPYQPSFDTWGWWYLRQESAHKETLACGVPRWETEGPAVLS